MLKITALVAASCLALASVPSYAGEAHHRLANPTMSKAPVQKKGHVVYDAKKHFEQQAIWPIYFYGCDDDDGMFACD